MGGRGYGAQERGLFGGLLDFSRHHRAQQIKAWTCSRVRTFQLVLNTTPSSLSRYCDADDVLLSPQEAGRGASRAAFSREGRRGDAVSRICLSDLWKSCYIKISLLPSQPEPPMTGTSTRFPVRRTAHYREERRIRIMGMVRSGLAYEAIAQEENLSRERIRQIVTQSLQAGDELTRVDQNRLQMARLEPALRLAARGVEEGRLQAISPLLKVLQQLDKYGAVVAMAASDTVGMHERL